MEKLSRVYASLPDNESLEADIFAVAQDLEKNENDQSVRTKPAHAIFQHSPTHYLKTESEIIALYNEVADSLEKYKGNAALAIMLGSLFHS